MPYFEYYLWYFSDEDTDVKALVTSWLSKQEEKSRELLTGLIDEFFYKALEWVLKQVQNDDDDMIIMDDDGDGDEWWRIGEDDDMLKWW